MDELLSKESIVEAMGSDLYEALFSSGVKYEAITKLVEDELDTPEILNDSSDEVLRTLGLKGGQITRIRNGLKLLKNKEIQDLTLDLEVQPLTSTPSTYYGDLPLLSTPNSSNHSSRSASPVFLPEKKAVPPAKLAFKDEETRATAKENWITSFKLPTLFSPSLADGLQKKSLDSKQRNEFNRDVCAAIKVHTLFLTKEERQRVAYLIIEKYPFLADTLGSGTVS
ncbi:uncharacterized protein LOC122954186 [Acropora millepora]|uniref:uncharacterized protein LOC122954186 n=2 Tax=Acropora millepora TaxID=45264 RepID=UPI001CF44781|nr:uncharacterized protein LOC122954186 [Acropora millepora]